jgi:Holliday junction resolvase RusA-like endonuclease
MGVADALRGRQAKELSFIIPGRVYSTKNSRVLGNGRSFMSKGAAAWLAAARKEIGVQYKGEPLPGAFEVTIRAYYADGRHHLDLDNLSSGILDVLKGLVVADDDPKHIRKLTASSDVSRIGRASVEIILTEVS